MNPKTQRIRLVFALIFFSAPAACGCGTAGPVPAATPSEKGGATPAEGEADPAAVSSVEGAIAEIDRAESELQRALGLPAFAQAPRAQAPGQMDQPPAPPAKAPAPTATAAADAAAGTPVAQESSGDPCQTACRALSGMNRATGHLCDLSGESDARCESARERVRTAGERVRSHCPSCSTD